MLLHVPLTHKRMYIWLYGDLEKQANENVLAMGIYHCWLALQHIIEGLLLVINVYKYVYIYS